MSFGFAVGDFIAAGKLLKDIIVILRTSARSEYSELMLELHGLQRALDQIEHLEAPPERHISVVGIKVAALMCTHVLDEFAGKLKKFESLAGQPGNSKLKIWTQKLRWGFTMADEVRNLRAYVAAHVGSLNMRLLTEELSSTYVASEKTQTSLVKVHESTEATSKVTRSIQSTLEGIATVITSELIPQLKTLVEQVARIWQSNTRVVSFLDKMQESPTPALQYTWFQAPVKFEDALGRVFPIPSEFDWLKVEGIILAHFSTGPGHAKVAAGEYELFDPLDSSRVISKSNFDGLRPGMSLTMALIIGRYSHVFGGNERCPRPGCRSSAFTSSDSGKQCTKCNICFGDARTRLPLPYRDDTFDRSFEDHNSPIIALSSWKRKRIDTEDDQNFGVHFHKVARMERLRFKNIRLSHLPLPQTPSVRNVRRAPKRKHRDPLKSVKRVRLEKGYPSPTIIGEENHPGAHIEDAIDFQRDNHVVEQNGRSVISDAPTPAVKLQTSRTTGDYTNIFANPPYASGSSRTRTSSNASFIEPLSSVISRSTPTVYSETSITRDDDGRSVISAATTPAVTLQLSTPRMAYTCTSNDKSPVPSSLAYIGISYSMTGVPMSAGVDPMAGYGHFDRKSIAQRDEEEQAFLFAEQSYDMGQIANTYPFEQYLDNYWRHFHPSFPVVHRATFDGMSPSPMLHAAMIAVGGQYSNDNSVKRKSRILYRRCSKLLCKRDPDVMTEPERLCDWQAVFLIEMLIQYRSPCAAKTLSTQFGTLYQKFCENFRDVTSSIADIVSTITGSGNATYDRWTLWIEYSSQQRLLLCCYILEYQQTILLGRNPQDSLIQFSGFDLPFPEHSALWDAREFSEWALAVQQYAHPTYVYEISPEMNLGPLDSFQSSLLIAANYNHFGNTTPYLAPKSLPAIDHLLDDSLITKHQLLTAKLLQYTPIRALLAVSGESWILSEQVPSFQAFSGYKVTLRTWVGSVWAASNDPQSQAAKDALKLAIEILQHAMMAPANTLRLEFGTEMGLYFAALTIWAVTVAINTRINAPQASAQTHRYQSHSPLPTHRNSGQYAPTPTHLSAGTSPNPTDAASMGLVPYSHTSPAPTLTSNGMLHSGVTMTCINFLNTALLELDLLGLVPQWPREVAQWQQGCSALMRWVKIRLRNCALEGRDSVVGSRPTSAGTSRGYDSSGELLDGVIAVLEKIVGRGWEGWGI